MSTESPVPRVGVSALIFNSDGKILTGKRIGSHGAGTIQLPGGHLEYGESFLQCAERETREETGLKVCAIGHVATTNDVFEEAKKHYITIFVFCKMDDTNAEPQTLEPEKCEGWNWRTWDDLMKIRNAERQPRKFFWSSICLFQQVVSNDIGLKLTSHGGWDRFRKTGKSQGRVRIMPRFWEAIEPSTPHR